VIFGSVPVAGAEGAILAHSVKAGAQKLRKGLTLRAEHVAALQAAGIAEVVAARLEPGDLHEDEAADRLARALVPDAACAGLQITAPFTGRVNLIARGPGVVVLDAAALNAFNSVHPMITIATVPAFQQMQPKGMVATIKIISYGVAEADVARACDEARGAIRLAAPVLRSASLIVTEIVGGVSSGKGVQAMRSRVEALGMVLDHVAHVPHEVGALSDAIAASPGDLVMILTGSATSDLADVAPEALRRAGGRVDRFGMPVDPGNLLFIGALGERPVIGLPGCARSPALNGADWVLSRVACGLAVTGADIAAMGVGGLLKEIPTRPQPRAGR
jgi:molybdenum cofactor cytidylyltransferase